MAYKVTIKARAAQAQKYGELIREAFDYTGTVYVRAQVEGQPNPDTDYWLVRAEVVPKVFIMFKIGPHGDQGQAILAAIVTPGTGMKDGLQVTELREAICDWDEAVIWVSRAWMHMNPDDPEVQQVAGENKPDIFSIWGDE